MKGKEMCNINTVGLGLTTASIASNIADNFAADDMRLAYQNARNRAILSNYTQQTKELNNSYSADYTANALQRQQDYIKNLQAKSAIQASVASKGLNGNSVDNLYRGYERAALMNNYLSNREIQAKRQLYNDRLENYKNSALNSINTQYTYKSNKPSTLLSGLYSYNNMLRNFYK